MYNQCVDANGYIIVSVLNKILTNINSGCNLENSQRKEQEHLVVYM